MPLTNKLTADYAELVNAALDNLPVQITADFASITEALRAVLNPDEAYNITSELQEAMNGLTEYLASPEMYVEKADDYVEYQQIVRTRITSKIDEFESFNDTEKQDYISEQEERKAQAAQNQELIEQYEPSPESRVLGHHEWLEEAQQRFQLEGVSQRTITQAATRLGLFGRRFPPQQGLVQYASWKKTIDHWQEYDSGGNVNRHKKYINDQPTHIKHIELYGHKDGSFYILVKAGESAPSSPDAVWPTIEHNQQFAQALEEQGISSSTEHVERFPNTESRFNNFIYIKASSAEELLQIIEPVLNAIESLEGGAFGTDLKRELIDSLVEVTTQPPTPPPF